MATVAMAVLDTLPAPVVNQVTDVVHGPSATFNDEAGARVEYGPSRNYRGSGANSVNGRGGYEHSRTNSHFGSTSRALTGGRDDRGRDRGMNSSGARHVFAGGRTDRDRGIGGFGPRPQASTGEHTGYDRGGSGHAAAPQAPAPTRPTIVDDSSRTIRQGGPSSD